MPHVHYTAEARQQAIARILGSRDSIARVAREVGCSVSTIHSWLRKHRRSADPPADSPAPATFIPVQVVDSRSPTVEIVTPNGFTVRINDVSSQSLAELLTALASC